MSNNNNNTDSSNQAIETVREVNLTKDITSGEKFLNEYKLISKLGNGRNGKVYLGENIETGDKYAIKEISKVTKISITNKDPKSQINKINNEIDLMKLIIQHPKILRLHKVLDDPKFNKIFLVLEYCSNGELKFGATYTYTLPTIRMILRDVVLGLEYLHGIGIVHRDIKPSNLLMNEDRFVKISDFGISVNRFQSSLNLSSFGTPAFLAPELCNISSTSLKNPGHVKIDSSIDIWALGVSIYCLFYQTLPFSGNNEYELFNEIIYNEIPYPNTEDKEVLLLIDLLQRMLNKDPKKRILLSDIKNHKFLSMDLSPEVKSEFLKFNEFYIFDRKQNFPRTSSIHKKFKSIFRRKSQPASNMDAPVFTVSTASLPADTHLDRDAPHLPPLINNNPQAQPISRPTSPSLSPMKTSSSHLSTSASPPPPATAMTATSSTKQSIPHLSASPPSIRPSAIFLNDSPVRPPLRNPLATSTNSLNLNSLLKSKREVPDYLDDSTYFQSMDSDNSSSSSSDDDDDDSEDGLYNDVEDTLSFRIGPKRGNSSLNMKTMNEYLDI